MNKQLRHSAVTARTMCAPSVVDAPAGVCLSIKRMWLVSFQCLTAVLLLILAGADQPESEVETKTAAEKVKQGMQLFRNSQYSEAETAFAEAGELDPENAIIAFDEACAALAASDFEQARSLFRKVSQAQQSDLAVKSHYNLGCLEADRAREKLGDDPAAATGDLREESINLLLASVRHYRDVLRLAPDHNESRHNLELIRLYIKHIQSQWAERDKQRNRDEKNLLQFLKMIEQRQTELRETGRHLADESDSASHRQALAETVDAQRELQQEIEPLKQKISQEFQAADPANANAAANSTSPDDSQNKEAEQLLHQLSDEAGQRMLSAADALKSRDFAAAAGAQAECLSLLNQLYMAVAPYEDILQRSIQQQQRIGPPSPASDADSIAEDSNASDSQPGNESAATKEDVPQSSLPAEQRIEQQNHISDWCHVLSLKAEQALPTVQQQLANVQQSLPQLDDSDAADSPPDAAEESSKQKDQPANQGTDDKTQSDAQPVEPADEQQAAQQEQLEQQRKQLQGLADSMQLALERGPEAEEHSAAAARLLVADDSAAAGEQLLTLQILKEIAKPLQQNSPPEQDQQNQNPEDQDQQKDQSQNSNENQQQDENRSGEDQDQNRRDQKESSQDEQQQNQQQPSQDSEPQSQKDAQQRQAESVLRQARERERRHRDLQKQLRAIIGQRIKVEKDW